MQQHKQSIIRRLPLPLLALVIGLSAGALGWLIVDRVQTHALSDIFEEALESQSHQVARESLIRFDQHRISFVYLASLLANHRRIASYLDPLVWSDHEVKIRHHSAFQPRWLPKQSIWKDIVQDGFVVLTDNEGRLREAYSSEPRDIPPQLVDEVNLFLAASEERAFLTTLDEKPYLIVSEPIEDTGHFAMGSLALVIPVNNAFLAASQQFVESEQSISAVLDSDTQVILSSSDSSKIKIGTSLESLDQDYVITAQSFFDYTDSDLNMMYATLVPRSIYKTTGLAVLDLIRQQRAIGSTAIIVIFVLLFVFLSSRINRLLSRLHTFSERALGQKNTGQSRTGNQLLALEERMRDVIEMVIRARDETRSRHETEIKETETLRVAVMEASLDSIITIDVSGHVVDVNHTAIQIFGRALRNSLGRSFSELVFEPDSASVFQDMLAACLADAGQNLRPKRNELEALDNDGNAMVVEVAIKPVFLEEELLFTVYIRDVNEQKAQQKEITALAAFPEESPSPMLRINEKGVITYANAASAELLSYWECQALQTLPLFWRNQVEEVLESKVDRELEVSTDNGEFSLLITPVPELNYVNIYARDITLERYAEDELKQREAELVHVARLSTMGEMSTGIAHELNQPLSAIANFANGCARRLRLDIGGKEELLSALQQISVQANRAAEIIKRLRSLVTRQQLQRSEEDLNKIILEVSDLLSHDLKQSQVKIERDLLKQPLWVLVDLVQIEQALVNLIRNALDSMSELESRNRRLKITSGISDKNQIFVSVSDNGSGIKEVQMEHLFDAFFTTKETGMGMGLAITQTIVEDHQGKIYATSAPAKGSTFTIELPLLNETTKRLAS